MLDAAFSKKADLSNEAVSIQNAFVLTAFSFAGVLLLYVVSVFLLFSELRIGMVAGAGTGVCAAALGVWAKLSKNIIWPARIFLTVTLLCATFVAFINGGADGYIAPFFIVVPLGAAYFLGARSSFVFGALAVLCIALLHLADLNGLLIESPFDPRDVKTAAIIVLITCILLGLITSSFFASRVSRHANHVEHSRALLASMAEVAEVGGWELDIKSMRLVWTDQTRIIHDVDEQYVPTLESAVAFYAPEVRDTIRNAVQDCIDNDESFDLELPLITARGRHIWVRAAGRRIDESGVPAKLIGAFQDITRQKEEKASLASALKTADKALSDLRAYQSALDLNVIVAITDAKGNITFANDKFCEISGYSREELLGQNHNILNSETHPRSFFVDMWRTIGKGNSWRDEICNKAKDGSLYWVDTTVIPICDPSGRPQQYVSIRYDITDRINYEKELDERRLQAEAASIAKSQFLATMSHEIRTPMNGVMGMLELMLWDNLSEKQKRHALIAQKSADRLLRIINDVLDFSKIEAGQVNLESIPFNTFDLIDHAVALMAARAGEKRLGLSFDIDDGVPKWLAGDPTRITQTLLNLIGNAVKFTDEGAIAVKAAYASGADGNLLTITVRDTGIGIPKEDQAKLFERFTQADSTTTRKFGGSGLGLAISKQLVELMGGETGVESEPGVGSTFWFAIPADPASAVERPVTAASDEASRQLPERPLKVLVVEDNAINQMIVETFLRTEGHAVTTVDDGAKAVDAVQAGAFDLVLMDIQMPVMDGVTATRTIRALPGPMSEVPIVAVTADAMETDRDKYLACGMDEYLSKPVQSKALFAVINRVMARDGSGEAETPQLQHGARSA